MTPVVYMMLKAAAKMSSANANLSQVRLGKITFTFVTSYITAIAARDAAYWPIVENMYAQTNHEVLKRNYACEQALCMLGAMQIEREQDFHVQMRGEFGQARRTRTFDDPKFTNVLSMQFKSTFRGDEEATAKLERLNSQVEIYFKYQDLTQKSDLQFKTDEEKLTEMNRVVSLFGKTALVGRHFKF